jgi:DNA-directed RNA polymerase subunit N (RpoN/RPB10)
MAVLSDHQVTHYSRAGQKTFSGRPVVRTITSQIARDMGGKVNLPLERHRRSPCRRRSAFFEFGAGRSATTSDPLRLLSQARFPAGRCRCMTCTISIPVGGTYAQFQSHLLSTPEELRGLSPMGWLLCVLSDVGISCICARHTLTSTPGLAPFV